MYKIAINASSAQLPEIQDWLDIHTPGWKHDLDPKKHWLRYQQINAWYRPEDKEYNLGSNTNMHRLFLIPEDDTMIIMVKFVWNADVLSVVGRPLPGFMG